jgi:hypothetical protein
MIERSTEETENDDYVFAKKPISYASVIQVRDENNTDTEEKTNHRPPTKTKTKKITIVIPSGGLIIQRVFLMFIFCFVAYDQGKLFGETISRQSIRHDDTILDIPITTTEETTNATTNTPERQGKIAFTTIEETTNSTTYSSQEVYRTIQGRSNKQRKIMYVHVGKTGGYTTDRVFRSNCDWYVNSRPKSTCYANFPSVESMLSNLTASTIHIRHRGNTYDLLEETTTFLFSVRNPISRAVSAFDMDHIQNSKPKGVKVVKARNKFYNCFPTAEHLAQILDGNPEYIKDNNNNDVDIEMCKKKGLSALQGMAKTATNTHLKYNYQTYHDMTLRHRPNNEVFVIRTEHLWNDISQLDKFLGGTGNVDDISAFKHDHGSDKYVVKSKLTQSGKKIFCQILSQEIAIYKDLILRASNLEESEKVETLNQLKEDCGEVLDEV